MTNERQTILLERLQEDEHLLGELEDPAATALLAWTSARVQAAAADPARPDDAVAADVAAIRQASRAAARSGERDPQRVVAAAAAVLGAAQPAPSAAPALQHAPPQHPVTRWSFFRRLRAARDDVRFRWQRKRRKDS